MFVVKTWLQGKLLIYSFWESDGMIINLIYDLILSVVTSDELGFAVGKNPEGKIRRKILLIMC